MIKENKTPFDYAKIKASLKNIHSKLVKSGNYTTTEDRRNNINICKGLIQDHFKKHRQHSGVQLRLLLTFKRI